MFRRTVSNDSTQSVQSSRRNEQPNRVYVTSLKNIAASSPGKTNWFSPPAYSHTPPSPARRALHRLLWPAAKHIVEDTRDDEPMISDSISDSKCLQRGIMGLALEESDSLDEHEVHCCKQDEANQVIQALQQKATIQIHEGRLSDALQNLNNSLSLQQKLHGKKHPKVADTLNKIGETLSNMGDDHRYMAMSALEEALAIRQELEPGSEDTAITLKNLWLLFHKSNVAISSTDKEETISFQDFDMNTQVY